MVNKAEMKGLSKVFYSYLKIKNYFPTLSKHANNRMSTIFVHFATIVLCLFSIFVDKE